VQRWVEAQGRTGTRGQPLGSRQGIDRALPEIGQALRRRQQQQQQQGAAGAAVSDEPEVTAVLTGTDPQIRRATALARLRKETAQAHKYELGVQTALGKVVSAEEVERGRVERALYARGVLLGGASTLAADVQGLETPEAERLLREWADRALRMLAGDAPEDPVSVAGPQGEDSDGERVEEVVGVA